jgi:hypothetical protein
MKIEIGVKKTEKFTDRWPGEFQIFSNFEMALGIPHSLFLITTVKENVNRMLVFNLGVHFQEIVVAISQ